MRRRRGRKSRGSRGSPNGRSNRRLRRKRKGAQPALDDGRVEQLDEAQLAQRGVGQGA